MYTSEYETDVLVHLFRNPILLSKVVDRLSPEHFQNQVKGDIWLVLRDLWRDNKERVNLTALISSIQDKAKERPPLFNPEDLPVIEEVIKSIKEEKYVMEGWTEDRLFSWLNTRESEQFVNRATRSVQEGKFNEIHDEYRDLVRKKATEFEDDDKDFFEKWEEIALRTEKRYEDRLISTGLTELNSVLGGGIMRGEFALVFGVENVGKSFFANQVGYSACTQKKRVLHVINEMEIEQLEERYLTRFLGVPKEQFKNNIDRIRREQERAKDLVGYLDMKYIPQGDHLDSIWAMLEAAKMEGNPYELVIIDYIDKFIGEGPTKDWLKLEQLFGNIQDMCRQDRGMDVAVLAVTHASAEGYNQAISSNRALGRSKVGKAKAVDISIFMGQNERDKEDKVVHLTVTKLRNRDSTFKPLIYKQNFSTGGFIFDEILNNNYWENRKSKSKGF